ncbi:MAG: hypothetical protein IT385_27325 [Deltaproteobacteria bacterium]|nr:hypothetical protein [Deltaproteobacteria bacterium]
MNPSRTVTLGRLPLGLFGWALVACSVIRDDPKDTRDDTPTTVDTAADSLVDEDAEVATDATTETDATTDTTTGDDAEVTDVQDEVACGPCDDGDPCTVGDMCRDGVCVPGTAPPCDDDEPCTDDRCDRASGTCVFTARDGACEDGDACTTGDRCVAGRCAPTGRLACDDDDPCDGLETCDSASGCVDGAPLVCDDGDACDGVETCEAGVGCKPGPRPVCTDDDVCTTDACDPATGCTYTPNTARCDDGDRCTRDDRCAAGRCVGAASTCDDSDPCTVDACDPATGACSYMIDEAPGTIDVGGVSATGATQAPVVPTFTLIGAARPPLELRLDGAPYVAGTPITEVGGHELVAHADTCVGVPATARVVFSIDDSPPTIRAVLEPPANADGWSRAPTTVSWIGEDDGPAAVTVSAPELVGEETAGTVVSGQATDAAGHVTSGQVTVRLDMRAPTLTITTPFPNQLGNDQRVTADATLRVAGTFGDDLGPSGFATGSVWNARVPREDGGVVVDMPGPFDVTAPLLDGVNSITVAATDRAGNVRQYVVMAVRDVDPPHVHIQEPTPDRVTTRSAITVAGLAHDLVVGAVTGDDVTVTVGGVAATVADGHFVLPAVPLVMGTNTITAVATDAVGRTASHTITITRVAPTGDHVDVVSGDGQTARVRTALAAPLVVKLLDQSGAPLAGRDVVFGVSGSDGTLAVPDGATAKARSASGRELLVTTAADGTARAAWTVGGRAGAGYDRVTVTAPGADGSVSLVASATPGIARHLYVHAGRGQIGEPGVPLAEPLGVLVTDADENPVADFPVTFLLTRGDGGFGSGTSMTATSNAKGLAFAFFVPGNTLGPSVATVTAMIPGEGGQPETTAFDVTVVAPGPAELTGVSGLVLDEALEPVAGAVVRFPQVPGLETSTGVNGRFRMFGLPPGRVVMEVHPGPADPTSPEAFLGVMRYELAAVPGRETFLDRPIYVLRLASPTWVDGKAPAALEVPELPGFRLEIPAGTTITFPDGGHEGWLSVTSVSSDQAPMPPLNGLQSRAIFTIQPPGTRFDPPLPLQIPNVDAYPPGRKVEMFSYDHDLESFVPIGAGSVSTDGTVVRSDPGVGVVKGGWHATSNPRRTGRVSALTAALDVTKVPAVFGAPVIISPTMAALIARGEGGSDATWEWCSAGTIELTGQGPCPGATRCTATARPKNGVSGYGKVRVVHRSGNAAVSAQETIELCSVPPNEIAWDVSLPDSSLLESITRRVEVFLEYALGLEVDVGVDVVVRGKIADKCCEGCGTIRKIATVGVAGRAQAQLALPIPTLGRTIQVGSFSVSVGAFVFISAEGSIGGEAQWDRCKDTWLPTLQLGADLGVTVGGRLNLLTIEEVIDLHGEISTGVTGTVTFTPSEGTIKPRVCHNGLKVSGVAQFGSLASVSFSKTLVCPSTLWAPTPWQPYLPRPDIADEPACNAYPPDVPEPACGPPPPTDREGDGDEEEDSGDACSEDAFNELDTDCSVERECEIHAECDDANRCNGTEWCIGHRCEPGTPLTCQDDGYSCTSETCDPNRGCVSVPRDAACDDGITCNSDRCDPSRGEAGTGCYHLDEGVCDDLIPCTTDRCDQATNGCKHTPNDALCNDGQACTVGDKCEVGRGCVFTPDDSLCEESPPVGCTTDRCVAFSGCVHTPDGLCDDGVGCTLDRCDPVLDCVHEPQHERCHETPDVGCTADTCTPTGCLRTPETSRCDDGDVCTDERCDATADCVSSPHVCPDASPCAPGRCDRATGCAAAPNDGLCADDGDLCTVERCGAGAAGCTREARSCDDQNECTDDLCESASGLCAHTMTPIVLNCQNDSDCPGDGLAFCNIDTAQVNRYTCAGGQCQLAILPCANNQPPVCGVQAGSVDCDFNQVTHFTCNAQTGDCVEHVDVMCWAQGQVCEGGVCVQPPP